MIVINTLICALLFLHDQSFSKAAASSFNSDRGMSFMRRRLSSSVKKVGSNLPNERDEAEIPHSAPARRYIKFELRPRTKSNDKTVPEDGSSSSKADSIAKFFGGFFQTLMSPIDQLEHDFYSADENREPLGKFSAAASEHAAAIDEKENVDESTVVSGHLHRPLPADLDNLLKCDFEDIESLGGSTSTSRAISKSNLLADAIIQEETKIPEETEDIEEPVADGESENGEMIEGGLLSSLISNFSINVNIEDISSTTAATSDESSDPLFGEIAPLSDSDLESWEKIEISTTDRIKAYVESSELSSTKIGYKMDVIGFLSSIFVKLARKLFFRPPIELSQSSMRAFNSFDDEEFVKIIINGDNEAVIESKQHKFLTAKQVEQILFYDEDDFAVAEWAFLTPTKEDVFKAFELYKANSITQRDSHQIELDLPRLPAYYVKYYAECRNRESLETDSQKLSDKIRIIFAFMIYFEGHYITEVDGVQTKSRLLDREKKFCFSQGFDQIAAYFAVTFDLLPAVTLTDRFIQVYMREIVGIDSEDMRPIYKKIDERACRIVKAFFDSTGQQLSLNYGIILEMLKFYPFSDQSASLLYFQSATNLIDLDRLVQFLLLKVPRAEAHKSISLLAAANMLFSFIALDELFSKEIGSDKWSEFKASIDQLGPDQRTELLDNLVLESMGQMFLIFKDKVVHAGKDFDDFLALAEKLVPLLKTIN